MPFLSYALFAITLAVISYPLYTRFKSSLKFAPLSAIVLIILLILIIIIPSIYITITVFNQARDIITNIGASQFKDVQQLEATLNGVLGVQLNFATPFRIWILDFSSTIRSYILANIFDLTKYIINFLAGASLTLFIMFYLFVDGKEIVESLKSHFPIEDEYKNRLFSRAYRTIQGLFLGFFLTALLQGMLGGLGYFLFGVPNVILLSVLTAAFSLVPFIGPPIVYVPASIYLMLNGNTLAGVGLFLYSILLISNIDNIVRPWVVRFRSKIHPLSVILGVIGGISILGFIGLFVGPLIITLFLETLDVYQMAKNKKQN